MTEIETLANPIADILASVGLSLLVYSAWHWLFVPASLELFRFDLEALRHRLFCQSRLGPIDPDTSAFQYVLNVTLRMRQHAHRVTFFRSLFNATRYQVHLRTLARHFDDHLDRIPDPYERMLLRSLQQSVLYCGLKHVVRTSAILVVPLLAYHAWNSARELIAAAREQARRDTAWREDPRFAAKFESWTDDLLHPFRLIRKRPLLTQALLIGTVLNLPMAVRLTPDFADIDTDAAPDGGVFPAADLIRIDYTVPAWEYSDDDLDYYIARVYTIPASEFLTALHPVAHLDVTTLDCSIADLLAAPQIGRLRSLDLSRLGLTDAQICELFAGSELAELLWLNLAANSKIGRSGVEGIAQAVSQGSLGLQWLELAGTGWDATPYVDGGYWRISRCAKETAKTYGVQAWMMLGSRQEEMASCELLPPSKRLLPPPRIKMAEEKRKTLTPEAPRH